MGSRYEYRERRKLVGGFLCRLTDAEANEFHEYIITTPEWSAAEAAERRFTSFANAVVGGTATREEMLAAHADAAATEAAIYPLSKKWFEDVIAPRIEAEEAVSK